MKTYTKEEALKKSIEYFSGDELAAEVFVSKYAGKNEKGEIVEPTPELMHKRMAKEFARIEQKYPNPISEEEIFGLFDHFKYVVPGGSAMFGIGNPNQLTSLSNCFVIDVVDSYGGICRADERIAQISKRRGGGGMDISPIRPKGMPTKNGALTTDGILTFMERFSNTTREVAQSGRRGALMLSISVHHPEIMTFIKSKRDLKKITGANISVRISDEFMEAVKKNKNYELRWPVDSKHPSVKQEIKAKDIWDELIKSNYISAEPGILYWDNIIKNSPADCYADEDFSTCSTNPCISGDTLVYVADGRGNVSIKQLADEGKDVPVFCYDDKGKVIIEKMRNPRITGLKQQIYKITLDDGCVVRTTGNHKILLKDGNYKETKDIVPGDSLKIITKYEASIKDIFPKANSNSKDYYWVNNGFRNSIAEHRIMSSYFYNKNKNFTGIVHHKDYDSKNNSRKNLKIMTKEEHDSLHCQNMFGDKNPMRRAKHEWSKEKLALYSENMSKAVGKERNGRYLNITNNDLMKVAVEFTKMLGHRFSRDEWQNYARLHNLPVEFSDWRKKHFDGVLGMSKSAAEQCGFEHIDEDPRVVRTLKSMIEQGYECEIKNGVVMVKKYCEGCGSEFWLPHVRREIGFCSISCSNITRMKDQNNRQEMIEKSQKWYKDRSVSLKNDQCNIYTYLKNKINRIPKLKEWESECKKQNIPFRLKTKYGFKDYNDLQEQSEMFNHRVVSVELDTIEDVYNGTVDKFHNFFIGGFESKTKNNKKKWVYINNLQCGELPLPSLDSCRLMSLNLSSYVDNPFTPESKFNEQLFESHVSIAQRLMDDMIDLEIEAVTRIIKKVESDPEPDDIKRNELELWNGIREKCEQGRRTGLGITGLGDCIAMLNQKYGSEDSIKTVDYIYKNLRNFAYKSSVQMAKDRGAFPIFDAKKEKDNEYLNRLPEEIKKEMWKVGRRNIGLLTTPPAGSLSSCTQTSSGFEPVFMAEYERKRKLHDGEKDKPDFVDALGDKWKKYIVSHPKLKLFKSITGKEYKDSPYFGALATEIDYMAKVKMQAIATSYVDHAISNTTNLPNDIPIETVEKIYMLAWELGCKGLTVYREGSRDGVLTKIEAPHPTKECDECDEASRKLKDLIQKGARPTKIYPSAAPKRENVIPCEIHRSKVRKGDWIFFVGLLNGQQPYEVFGGDSAKFTIPHKYKNGWIIKNGKNKAGITQYNLVLGSLDDKDEKLEFKDINKHFNNKEFGAFTRMVSLHLRHGTPIRYICEQLTKTGCAGDLFSFQRAMSRILKKYIADGEKSEVECPICKSTEVFYKGGCPTCKVCGNSNCS